MRKILCVVAVVLSMVVLSGCCNSCHEGCSTCNTCSTCH
jgi:hypothetical protein